MRKKLTVLLLAASALASAAPVRTLIISGRNNHDWRTTTPFLQKLLLATGRFDVRLEEEPAGITAATLAGYDLLILDYQGTRWGAVTEKAVLDFVRSGKGLVAVHGASYAFSGLEVLGDGHRKTGIKEPAWPEYVEMIGGTWVEGPQKTGHAPRHLFTVKVTDRSHPIVGGMAESFDMDDELYHSIKTQPNIHVLATASDDPKIGGTGKDEPMLWTVNYGQGRVFHTALGHDVAAMQEPGFAISFVRGAEWAATGEVTLPAAFPEARDANPVRVEVITGGHGHDADFYAMFAGRPDMQVNINGHPDAYSRDMRKDLDVLVLYDMVQTADVSEAKRRNLQQFVESGKGLVVMHHAIADFGEWPWWYEQVVGGKYFLKPEGSHPGSTYKHDEDELIEAVGQHPITRGLQPLHLVDETYKGKWISPNVKVILKSNNPTDDGPVAWISPYEKSRVVYIELGHDRLAHRNPGYQELVHRAILWAAGRLD